MNMFVINGLVNSGEITLAKDLATKFCDNMSEQGLSESYDPHTSEAY
jgi:hypothetical protein